jgi:hypothetical protein
MIGFAVAHHVRQMSDKSARGIEQSSLGLLGGDTISDTSAHPGEWYAFIPLGEVQITSITRPDFSPATTTGITTSTPLFGKITSITLASGKGDLLK